MQTNNENIIKMKYKTLGSRPDQVVMYSIGANNLDFVADLDPLIQWNSRKTKNKIIELEHVELADILQTIGHTFGHWVSNE